MLSSSRLTQTQKGCHLFGLTSRTNIQTTPKVRGQHKISLQSSTASKIETPIGLQNAQWTGSTTQRNALEELNKRLACRSRKIDAETVLWFLRDRNFDPVEAEDKLVKTCEWRERIGWNTISLDQFASEYKTGKVRLHEHMDVVGRPVVLLDASKHLIGQFPVKSTKKLCAYVVREAISLIPKDKETFISIIDLRNFGAQNADLKFIKYMIDLFFIYNPKRLGQSLLVEPPWIFKPVWNFTKPLLRKYADLVRFVTVDELSAEYFTKDTIPLEFKQ